MTDQDWRRVSQGLVALLAVLVLAVIAVIVLRPPNSGTDGGAPSSSPVTVAGVSPSPGIVASPSPSGRGSPRASPRTSPSPGASASAVPEPTPIASPSPSPVPAAPLRTIRFMDVGIDGPAPDTTPVARIVTFASQGPGKVTATLGQTSAGNVRFCLYTGDQPSGNQCRTTRGTALTGTATAAGNTRWHVSVIGLDQANLAERRSQAGVPRGIRRA